MTKQKIVIKVQSSGVFCDKCRTNALTIAAKAKGVSLVSVEGENGENDVVVVVIGEGVDSICLGRALKRKFGYAEIISVEQLREENENHIAAAPNTEDEEEEEEPEPERTSNPMELPPPIIYCDGLGHHHYPNYYLIHESYGSDNCIIM